MEECLRESKSLATTKKIDPRINLDKDNVQDLDKITHKIFFCLLANIRSWRNHIVSEILYNIFLCFLLLLRFTSVKYLLFILILSNFRLLKRKLRPPNMIKIMIDHWENDEFFRPKELKKKEVNKRIKY